MNDRYKLNKLRGKEIFAILGEHRGLIDDYFWEYYKNFTSNNLERYIRDVCHFANPYGIVLSIGCGHGLNEIFMADMCKDVKTIQGIDVVDFKIDSMNTITNILNFDGVKGIIGDGTNLEFPDEKFDCVIIIESLSHVNDQYQVLKEAFRVLKSGGHIFVLDFNNGANPRILYRCWKERYFEGVEENPVNPYFVRNRLQDSGIVKIIIKPYGFTPFLDKLGAKLLSKMPNIPVLICLLLSKGFMLVGKKR